MLPRRTCPRRGRACAPRTHPSSAGRIGSIALEWIAATTAFPSVVRKPQRCGPENGSATLKAHIKGCSQPSNLTPLWGACVQHHPQAQNKRLVITAPQRLQASWLRLHRLEKGEDGPERLIIQEPRPVWHPLVRSAVRDREIEQVCRFFGIAVLEPAEISGRIGADRIRSMAVCAILVEQAAPRGGPVGLAPVGFIGRNRRIVRVRIPRRTWQTEEDGEHARPREDCGSNLRGRYLHAVRLPHAHEGKVDRLSWATRRRTARRPR